MRLFRAMAIQIPRIRLSLRQSMIALLGAVGLASALIVIFSARYFMQIVYDSRQASINELLHSQINNTLLDLRKLSRDLGNSLQQEPSFKRALASNDPDVISRAMDDQFAQYYTTTGILRLEKLYVLDPEYAIVAMSNRGFAVDERQSLMCENIVRGAREGGHDLRLKTRSGLCSYGGLTFYGVLQPMGMAPRGYLLVVTDPTYSISMLRKTLSEPLRIQQADGRVVFAHNDWPQAGELSKYVIIRHLYPFDTPMVGASQYALYAGKTAFIVSAAQPIESVSKEVNRAMYAGTLISVGVLAVALLIALTIQNRALRPLERLQQAAERFSSGNYEFVRAETYPEIARVTHAYNGMAERISQLIGELEVTRAQAVNANAMKSRFLADMSHEIRTPLGVVLGYAELLSDDKADFAERKEFLHALRTSGLHLRQIINNILDISKIEAGELRVEKIPMRPLSLVHELQSMFAQTAREKGVGFRVEIVTDLPKTLYSDPVRARQIMINILNNAFKFTSRGSVVLTVSYRVAEKKWVLMVADSGMGMTEDALIHAFQPYRQGESSITRRFGGTGLGLNLSRQLARLLGGDISATSSVGIGSTFTVTLDAGDIVPSFERDKYDALESPTKSNVVYKFQGSVLLAEDTPAQRDLMRIILSKLGILPDFAENGVVAVEKASAEEYDLILMDMQMPELGGLDAIRTLRSNGYARPIVVLSANALDTERNYWVEGGADDYLVKPVDREALITVLKRYLKPA